MIEREGQGCVVRNRERSVETIHSSRELRILRRQSGDFDRRARTRIYGRAGSIYGPATDKNNVARGGVELKSNRESFGTWEALVFFSFSRAYNMVRRCRRERVSE